MFGPRPHLFRMLDDLGGIACLGFVVVLAVTVTFLATLARALTRVDPPNRRMDPGLVWLNLIPVFNLIWLVVTVERVGESIRNEMAARGRLKKSDPYGKTAGITGLVLLWFGIFLNLVGPPAGLLLWFFALVYLLVYWAQVSMYSRKLRDQDTAYTPPPDEGW